MTRLRLIAQTLRRELLVYRLALNHPQTPCAAKICLWLAIGYTLLPFDLVPDFVPIVGHLDDAVIVPGLILLAIKLTPPEVMAECRREATSRIGTDR